MDGISDPVRVILQPRSHLPKYQQYSLTDWLREYCCIFRDSLSVGARHYMNMYKYWHRRLSHGEHVVSTSTIKQRWVDASSDDVFDEDPLGLGGSMSQGIDAPLHSGADTAEGGSDGIVEGDGWHDRYRCSCWRHAEQRRWHR